MRDDHGPDNAILEQPVKRKPLELNEIKEWKGLLGEQKELRKEERILEDARRERQPLVEQLREEERILEHARRERQPLVEQLQPEPVVERRRGEDRR